MTNEFEKKASDIFIQISKKETSFEKAAQLYFETLEVFGSVEKEEITDKLRETMANIFVMFVGKNRDFAEKWLGGEVIPSDDQLNLSESNCEEILEHIDKINQKLPQIIDDDYCSKTKEGVKKLKQKVQQEKTRRQQPELQQPNNQSPTPSNNQQVNQLQNQLNQLSQQIQSLMANQNKNPEQSNNNQFQQLQEQLNNFQSQIQGLENKLDTPNSPVSQSDKQELTKLKSQIQQLQKDLKSKQENKTTAANNSQQQPKQFNWLYLVIPMGAVILIMGIIIFAFWRKKNKNN